MLTVLEEMKAERMATQPFEFWGLGCAAGYVMGTVQYYLWIVSTQVNTDS